MANFNLMPMPKYKCRDKEFLGRWKFHKYQHKYLLMWLKWYLSNFLSYKVEKSDLPLKYSPLDYYMPQNFDRINCYAIKAMDHS